MTEPTKKDTSHSTAASQTPTTSAPTRRRWRRRLLWIFAIVLIVGMVLRLVLAFSLPGLIENTVAHYGLECEYERLDLSLLAGDLELWHLALRPAVGEETYVDTEYLRADIDVLDLFRGRLSVRRLEVDGMDVTLDRQTDGSLALLEHFASDEPPAPEDAALAEPAAEEPPAEDPDAKDPETIDLRAPLSISALRLQHVRILWRDASVTPPFEDRLEANVRLSSLGSEERPTRFALSVASTTPDAILDVLQVEGEGRSTESALEARFRVALRGLHPMRAHRYLEVLGLKANGETLSVAATAEIQAVSPPTPDDETEPPAESNNSSSNANPSPTLTATATFSDLAVTVDDEPAVELERVHLEASSLSSLGLHLKQVVCEQGTVALQRHADGSIEVAGIVLPAANGTATSKAPPADAAPIVPATSDKPNAADPPANTTGAETHGQESGAAFAFRLDELGLRHLAARLEDAAVSPPATLRIELEEFTARDIVVGAATPPPTIHLQARLHAPGVVEDVDLKGEALLTDENVSLNATLGASGIVLTELEPYLAAAGAEAALDAGQFTAKISTDFRLGTDGAPHQASARLEEMIFQDRMELFGLRELALRNLALPSTGDTKLHLEALEVRGLHGRARRDSSGVLEILGLRLGVSQGSAPAETTPPTDPQAADPAAPSGALDTRLVTAAATEQEAPATPALSFPDLSIGTVLIEETELHFEDEFIEPATTLRVSDAGVEVRDLALGKTANEKSASVRAWLVAPGLAEPLTADGAILTTPTSVQLDVNVRAGGVTTETIVPYLIAAGLEPALQEGSLSLHVHGDATADGANINASLALKDISYKDGDKELFGLGAFTVNDVVLSPSGLEIREVEVDRPRVSARRGTDGSFSVFGVTIPVGEPSSAKASSAAESETVAAPPPSDSAPFELVLGALRVAGATFRLDDKMPQLGQQLEATLDLNVGRVTLTEAGTSTPIELTLRVPETLERLSIIGTINASRAAQDAAFKVEASGIHGEPLTPYLPSGLRVTLNDGYLATQLAASATVAEGGDLEAAVRVDTFDFRDGGSDGDRLLGFDSLRAAIGHLAKDGSRVEIKEVALAALETEVRLADGVTYLPGLALKAPAEDTGNDTRKATGEDTTEPTQEDDRAPSAKSGSRALEATVTVAKLPPLVLLGELNLHVARCDLYLTATDTDAPPLTFSDVRLVNNGPWSLLGEAAETQPPLSLRLSGAALPVAGSFQVEAQAAPFAAEPHLGVEVQVAGLEGQGLTAVLPELAAVLDGTAVHDGRIGATLDATLRQQRRQPWELDFTQPFGAEAALRAVEFRATANGPVLAGFGELRTEVASVETATGEVHVRAIELSKIQGSVRRTAEGIEALGFLLKIPNEETPSETDAPASESEGDLTTEVIAPPTDPVAEPATDSEAAQAVVEEKETLEETTVAAELPSEIRIDRVLVSGIDFLFEDQAVEPPTIVPLNGLEVELSDLTSHAPYENRPVRFNVLLNAGKVPLPKALKKSAIAGGIGDMASLLTGQEIEPKELEDREVVQEISASGKLSLFPRLAGWSKVGVSALELVALRGEAAAAGVTIDQGVLDCAIQVRFAADGTMGTRSKFRFTDLSVSEPPDGPIFRYLSLPAPLDAVLFALRDENGSIEIPLNFELDSDGISPLAASQAATAMLTTLIVNALASAPLRAAGTVTELVPGLTGIPGFGGADEPQADEVFTIHFAPADAGLDRTDRELLDGILEKLRDNDNLAITLRHQFGQADLPLIERRANPGPEECVALVEALRSRKSRLTKERHTVAAHTRAAFGARLEQEAEQGRHQLRALETQLGRTEEALDSVLELLRPGAERQAPRRTRQAATVVGQLRLRALRDHLLRADWEGSLERLRLVRTRFEETSIQGGGLVEAVLSVREDL